MRGNAKAVALSGSPVSRSRSASVVAAFVTSVCLNAATAPATVLVTGDTSSYSYQSGMTGTVSRQLPIAPPGFSYGDTNTLGPFSSQTRVDYSASGSKWSPAQPNGVVLQNYHFSVEGPISLNDPSYLPSAGVSVNDLVSVSNPAGAPDALLKFGPATLTVDGSLASGDALNLLLECTDGGSLQLTGYNTPGPFQFTITGAEQDILLHASDSRTMNYYVHIFASISHGGTGTSSLALLQSTFTMSVPEPSGVALAATAVVAWLLPGIRRRFR
jgi:hypothetical protein